MCIRDSPHSPSSSPTTTHTAQYDLSEESALNALDAWFEDPAVIEAIKDEVWGALGDSGE